MVNNNQCIKIIRILHRKVILIIIKITRGLTIFIAVILVNFYNYVNIFSYLISAKIMKSHEMNFFAYQEMVKQLIF